MTPRPALIALLAAAAVVTVPAAAAQARFQHNQTDHEFVVRGQLPPEACATLGGAGTPYRRGINCRTIEVDGHPRRFIAYVPRRRPETGSRRPVVFMFHGSSGSGDQFLRVSGWRQQADATGLVAVFPTGARYRILDNNRISTKWNAFGLRDIVSLDERPDGYPEDAPWPADDVGFVDAMVRDLGGGLPIDSRRIHASGFSNGADFAARLTVARSRVLASAAFSAGSLRAPRPVDRPVPTWMTVGALDDRLLGQVGLPELPLEPPALLAVPLIAEVVGAHLATLGLDETLNGALALGTHADMRWPAFGTGPNGGIFRFTVLGGLGHSYPHVRNNDAAFEAAEEFWPFLRANPLPEADDGAAARATAVKEDAGWRH
jgi:polyhydroxybutyrate depolymerase